MPNIKKDHELNNNELHRIRKILDFHDGKSALKTGISLSESERSKKVIGTRDLYNPAPGGLQWGDKIKEMVDSKIINPEKTANKSAKTQDYIGSYYNWNGPLIPEYDMQEPMAILDTEAYVKQTINRRLALMFRNGYEVVGRDRDVAYINNRISTMEYVTNRSFRAIMKRVMFCLFLQANCFLLKIRKPDASGVPQKEGRQIPVSGYTIIPSHQIQPYLVKGVISKWRRYYDTGKFFDEYPISEIIHFKLDPKPWQIFGTPRTVGVREDIFALRRLEENTELLFINYLFPLFHVKVGTETNPATYTDEGMSELDLVRYQIENMPKEGVFITDERTFIEVVGAKSQVLDFMAQLNYYKARVFAGLGMSELDMGSSTHGGSAVSDNISQNLKDSIKADVEEFADQVKFFIFKEWLAEANYSVSVQAALTEIELTFHEIDLDNKIKHENHILNLYNSNLVSFEEARKRMALKPVVDQKELHINRDTAWLDKMTQDHAAASQITVLKATKALGMGDQNTTTTKKTNGNTKNILAITKKSAPLAKKVQNIVTPINQHGQKTSQLKVGHDSFISILKDKLLTTYETLDNTTEFTDTNWKLYTEQLIDESFNEFEVLNLDDSDDKSYTKHLQDEIINLKAVVACTNNPEELELILDLVIEDNLEKQELDPEPELEDEDNKNGKH
jgi:hypothetical protein